MSEIAVDVLRFRQVLDEVHEENALFEDVMRALDPVSRRQTLDTQFVETRAKHAAVARTCPVTGEVRLAYQHRFARASQHASGTQTAKAAADDKRVDLGGQRHERLFGPRRSLPPVGVQFHILEDVVHTSFPASRPGYMLCWSGFRGQ